MIPFQQYGGHQGKTSDIPSLEIGRLGGGAAGYSKQLVASFHHILMEANAVACDAQIQQHRYGSDTYFTHKK